MSQRRFAKNVFVNNCKIATAPASYRIDKPRNPENRRKMSQKNRQIPFLPILAYFLPIFKGCCEKVSVSWVAKFKGDKISECKLSNGWSRSYKVTKLWPPAVESAIAVEDAVENRGLYRAPQSAHHPHKSYDEHRPCNPGRGIHFAVLLGSDNSYTTPFEIPFLIRTPLWWRCMVGGPRLYRVFVSRLF